MSVSTMSPLGSENKFLITSEALLPLVKKCFGQISQEEWVMLASGIQHPATEATLLNMLVDIVQAVSAAVLKMVVPVFQERLSSVSPVELESYAHTNTCLGDSLSQCFAEALGVPQIKSQSMRELSTLIEQEVSERVRSVLSTAASSTVWPSEPALYVPPTMSNSKNLHRMVSHAFTCLKRLSCRMSSQHLGPPCLRLKDNEVDRWESMESVNSAISVPLVTKSVSDILQKWSAETVNHTEEAETSLEPLSDSSEARDAASEIATTISEDLYDPVFGGFACCSERSSPRPRYNIRLVLDKVRGFFARQAVPPEDTLKAVHKRTFFKIARDQFEAIMEELKTAFHCKETDLVVSLKQDTSRSLPRVIEEVAEVTLPGAIPDSPRPESVSSSRTTMTSLGHLSSLPVDFDTIKSDVDSLFDKSDRQAATCVKKEAEKAVLTEEIKKFLRELTDKMYHHIMMGQTYQTPILPMGRSLSDSVISERRFNVGTTRSNFSPEVLYAMTEDAAGKFCQLMLHWMEKEPSMRASYDEKVCGAFDEIDGLIARSLTPTEEDGIRLESPEAPTSQEVIFVGPESPKTPTSQEVILVGPESPETQTSQEVIFIGPESPEAPTSQEVIVVEPEFPETSKKLTETPSLDFCRGADFCELLKVRLHVDSRTLASQKIPQRESTPDLVWEETKAFLLGTGMSSSTLALLSNKSIQDLLTTLSQSQSKERLSALSVHNLVSALVMRLIGHIPWKVKKDLLIVNVNAIINRVSDRAQEEDMIHAPSIIKAKDVKKINKAVIKDLLRHYKSPQLLMDAAMETDDSSFATAVLKYLTVHLNEFENPTKKSKVADFFSNIGRVLAKPFRLCFMDTSCD